MIAIKLKGSQIILQVLQEEGVDVIFGYPGGMTIDIYDDLARSQIRHVLVRHEQGAVHAADGYARASGKTGVCLVTSGPGATNTVTGIASAYMDSIPIVVLTGQVPTRLIGNDAFQEVDIVGITRPCTKHNYLVSNVEDLTRILKEAFYIARSGRPGPVLVDLPKDVIQAVASYKSVQEVNLPSYNPTYEPNMKQLPKAVKLIRESRMPMVLTGGGVILSGAAEELRAFVGKIQAPVASTLMGLGAFPASDPLWLGMIGMHGTYSANMAVNGEYAHRKSFNEPMVKIKDGADLLIAVGVRFDDRVTGKVEDFAPRAKIIHIDIDPTSIRKNIPVAVPIVADCKITLGKLNDLIEKENLGDRGKDVGSWISRVQEWKGTKPLAYEQKCNNIKPQFVIEKLNELSRGNAIITTEVGQNQMWTAQFFQFEQPNRFITSGGLGCMGFGLPAAIGAQIACPDRLVVDIAGDGSIQMNIQEMATAVQYGLPVKIVILNNRYLGMVRQWQEFFYDRCYSCTGMEHAPDFVKLAEAYGAVGLRATRPDEVEKVLQEGLATPKPVIMDFLVEREECVYPMVPAGKAITEMLLT